MTTASKLATYLAEKMPEHGSISRYQAEQILFKRSGHVPAELVAQAIIVALSRGLVSRGHGGATLRRRDA